MSPASDRGQKTEIAALSIGDNPSDLINKIGATPFASAQGKLVAPTIHFRCLDSIPK